MTSPHEKLSRSQAKLIRSLHSRKRRTELGSFLVEGVRLVEELLASGWAVSLAVTAEGLGHTARGRALLARIDAGAWPRARASEAEMKQLADTETPQGVLAVARRPQRQLQDFRSDERSSLVVFDRVSDPGNLGTLLRTCEALGVGWTVALPGTVDPWSPKVVRASAGSLFRLPLSEEPWPDVAAWLRREGFTILCADPAGEPVSRTGGQRSRFALVLGNEPFGLSEKVQSDCDQRVAVALSAAVDSLNVAIAGALLLDRLLAS